MHTEGLVKFYCMPCHVNIVLLLHLDLHSLAAGNNLQEVYNYTLDIRCYGYF